jgi:hypothetical protein
LQTIKSHLSNMYFTRFARDDKALLFWKWEDCPAYGTLSMLMPWCWKTHLGKFTMDLLCFFKSVRIG